jgi:tetratricopeptide (TPR) repeat protein/ribosomal protein S27AE
LRPNDPEIYERLGTIYQRLGDLIRADQAIQQQLDLDLDDGYRRAEAYALIARNEKDRWRQDFAAAADRQAAALSSPHLRSSIDLYEEGFFQSLNHFYSGLNALALLKMLTEVARARPEIWLGMYDDDDQAKDKLVQRMRQMGDLTVTVRQSLAAAQKRLPRIQQFVPTDERIWTGISEADLMFLTIDRPERITNAYRTALKDGQSFHHDAARRQIELYESLGLFAARVEAALKVIEAAPVADNPQKPPRVLLFTGHMVDAPDRKTPRFPRTAPAEAKAKAMIQQAVAAERALAEGGAIGISGGACGGDILFQDVCREMNIPSRLFLALPQDKFQHASVRHGGPDWVERYGDLCERIPPVVLAESEELPRWLCGKDHYMIWERNNLWMLSHALAMVQGQGARLTVISLWDGQGEDGPGGTADMVRRALDAGAKRIALDAKELLRA